MLSKQKAKILNKEKAANKTQESINESLGKIKQLWAGNPVRYVRDLYEPDDLNLSDLHAVEIGNIEKYFSQFEDFGHAHMYDS